VQSDWYFISSLTERPTAQRWERGYRSLSGANQVQRTASSAANKIVQDTPAPNDPPVVTSVSSDAQPRTTAITILSCGPNPARDAYAFSYVVAQPSTITVTLRDVRGGIVWSSDAALEHGLNSLVISTSELAAGRYRLEVSDGLNRAGVDLIRQK
jgi:hypothetical protein